MKRFAWLIRIEAMVCLGLALIAFALPEILIRLLSQAPVGSLVAWMDVVVLVRTAGWGLLCLTGWHWAVSMVVNRPDAVAWTATVYRVAFGWVRWSFLAKATGWIAIFGWLDLGLATLTVYTLLQAQWAGPSNHTAVASPRSKKLKRNLLVVCAIVFTVFGFGSWWYLLGSRPETSFTSDEEHFKYAPLMKPEIPGIPLYIFEALPETFPDKLPGGWASLGFIIEADHTTPVGFAHQSTAFPSLSPNCALCHSSTYRIAPDAPTQFVSGAPAESLDFHGFLNFLFESVTDPRFTDGSLLAKIKARHSLSGFETATYSQILIPAMAEGIKIIRQDFAWIGRQPTAGPGRQDAGTLLKYNMLRMPYDGTIATSDFRPIWNQKAGYSLFHRWSGGGVLLQQENLLAAAMFNMLQPSFMHEKNFSRMTNYFASLQPPKYPLPILKSLLPRGETVFKTSCANCHQPGSARYNTITPLAEIGTDGEYLAASTRFFLDALMAINDPPFWFNQQQHSNGYLNSSLEGIWLRGPYLHNGSVPTISDLLEPPTRRPGTYLRGGNVLDTHQLGFRTGIGAPNQPFEFDTRLRGNSNGGHNYGVDLPAADKQALIEFLKTL
jgi:hypothetical protein